MKAAPSPQKKAKLQLPKVYENNERVREYLTKERKISERLLTRCLQKGKFTKMR